MSSKHDPNPLHAYRDALLALAARVVPATGRVEVVTTSLSQSSGSAWLFDDHHWVTNHHVIAHSGKNVQITTAGRTIDATVLGSDEGTDLAVLRSDRVNVTPLSVRKSQVSLGEPCYAFGAPLGTFPDSMTSGIVSGLERRLANRLGTSIEDVLQTDAAINPGNSGGPLVDVDAKVIGVNTAIRADADNMGFAVPAATVISIVPELIEHGYVARATLGASVEARPSGRGPKEELMVLEVRDPSSLLRRGDVLVSIDGKSVERRADLFNILRRTLIGRTTTVEVRRDQSVVSLETLFSQRAR